MPRQQHLLLSIHGIRTLSEWQSVLSSELQQEHYVHYPIVEVRAEGWTEEGQRISELLGLVKSGVDRRRHPIYSAKLPRPADPGGRPGSMITRLRHEYERGRRP